MDEAVDGGDGDGFAWEEPGPFLEGLVGGQQHGAALISQ